MSELLAEIKAKQINARKARLSTATLLTTLIGEAEMVGKNQGREVTDSEVLAMIKKFIKNITTFFGNSKKTKTHFSRFFMIF